MWEACYRVSVRAIGGLLYGLSVLAGATLSGLIIGTVGVLPFALLPRGTRERYAMPAASLWARTVLWMLGLRLTVKGTWPLPARRGALVLCNHRSWLDPVALMAVFGINGLSKMQIFWLPFIGLYGYLSGAVFFRRSSKEGRARARAEVLQMVHSGSRPVVFPEGTRQRGGHPGKRVYLNLAMDAFKEGVPVVPCAIVHSERSLPPDEPAAWPFAEVTLCVMPALLPDDHGTSRAFATKAWDAVVDRYNAEIARTA